MAWQLQVINGMRYYHSQLLAGLPWLVHGFSTRWGQRGEVWIDFNLGYGLGESAEVTEHRRRFFALFQLTAGQVHTVKQVHGDEIITVDNINANGELLEADGLMTNLSGVGLATVHADCVPALVVDPVHRAIAAVHAGWKGTLAGIVQKTVRQMGKRYGSEPVDCWAAIGPAIGDCCYRVSRERFRLFQTTWPEVELLTSGEGYSLNLEKINYHHLVNSGLRTENIDCANLCTSCQVESFYSYRREQETGRMLSLVALK